MIDHSVIDTPSPVQVLIPEARQRQRRRYRRRTLLCAVIALLVGALVVLSVTTVSNGSGTARTRSNQAVLVPRSGILLIRPVRCFAPPFVRTQQKAGPAPSCGSPYRLTPTVLKVVPNSVDRGYSTNDPGPDPAFAGSPSSSGDAPSHAVLLPGLSGGHSGQRYVLGPSEMRLSAADVTSASARETPVGQWNVTVHFTAAGSAAFDRVAASNFHEFLAIDMGGKVVSAPLIQPTRSSFSSFEGTMVISGPLTAANARTVAAAAKR